MDENENQGGEQEGKQESPSSSTLGGVGHDGGSEQNASNQHTEPRKTETNDSQKGSEGSLSLTRLIHLAERLKGHDAHHWWIVIATWVLVILTLTFGWCQNCAYQRTVELENRAYVVANIVDFDSPFQVGQLVSVQWGMRNVGNTPALRVRAASQVIIVPNAEQISYEKHIRAIDTMSTWTGFTLGFGYDLPQAAVLDHQISQSEWDSIWQKRANLIVLGKIVYRDRFGYEQWTKFSAIYNTNDKAFRAMIGFDGAS